ncbi:hypothetical protein FOXG_20872 [Fusarium oxysporum f. sp. lycopersici 4287]|uniref:Uncharacterized protein n=1 Tax=Fusarium oxysporum f. sp. lycopersici (strain 4287 / CBS 123668 / FGSC 9935 / NRRL 34936) TaxID=426428 RepID=A0A0J9WS50_FUSO4|nr:hypothetical protein FOXG_20872 [Fusarium oxysporum f. sp. lycopersici 4287]KAJ9412920.1 hypothetical protein QL093DRAFT_2522096 [Fusarium oxysporum]KNB13667.1 hypothetical protein FOXG_20872 [Fusarium oxysporum f. sp. lycopersici 4287]
MPKWFQHESNEGILYGYRDISGPFQASMCSLLYIHNESVNIYTHLIPAVFSFLGQQYLASRYSGVTGVDFTPFSIFMSTAVTCLSLSAIYHTLMNHSKRVEHLCRDESSSSPIRNRTQYPNLSMSKEHLNDRCI